MENPLSFLLLGVLFITIAFYIIFRRKNNKRGTGILDSSGDSFSSSSNFNQENSTDNFEGFGGGSFGGGGAEGDWSDSADSDSGGDGGGGDSD